VIGTLFAIEMACYANVWLFFSFAHVRSFYSKCLQNVGYSESFVGC